MSIKLTIAIFIVYVLYKVLISDIFDSRLIIKVLDVGQGDAILITTPGKKHILIDAGPDFYVDKYLADSMPFLPCRIDAVILTHPHLDHLGGMKKLLKRCKIDNLFVNFVSYKSLAYKYVISQSIVVPKPLIAGDVVEIDGLRFYVLGPPPGTLEVTQKNANNYSVVMLMKYKDFDALFPGDAEKNDLDLLNVKDIRDIAGNSVDFYKVSHHGSRDALNKDFLRKIVPRFCVISAGNNNKYNLPNKEVEDFLLSLNCVLQETFKNGTVGIKI